MVERFLEQHQAVCAVSADDRKKWYLMPKDPDITILETVKQVLSPISSFTDALSGEKHTTLSSVLPLTWKIFSTLTTEEGTCSNLEHQQKEKIRNDLMHRYEEAPTAYEAPTADIEHSHLSRSQIQGPFYHIKRRGETTSCG